MYFNYGLFAGIGIGTVFNCSVTVLDPYFKRYKRTALGLAISGLGAGSFVYPPILTYLEDTYGWRGAILLMAGITAHMMVFSSLFTPFKADPHKIDDAMVIENVTVSDEFNSVDKYRDQFHMEGNNGSSVKSRSIEHNVKQFLLIFRTVPYLCLMLYTLIGMFAVSIIITHFGNYVLTK